MATPDTSLKQWHNTNETNLPLALFLYTVKGKKLKPSVLRTYLAIKLFYPDRLFLTDEFRSKLASKLKLTRKTLNNHLYQLIKLNFLGYDEISTLTYIRSKYSVVPKEFIDEETHLKSKNSFSFKVRIEHLEHFTEFIYAAAVAYLNRKIQDKRRRQAALKSDGALQPQSDRHERIFLALSYVAEFLNKSVSWAEKYKKRAQNLGWITVSKQLDYTGAPWQSRMKILDHDQIGRARRRKDELCLVLPDCQVSSVYLKKKSK